MVFKTISENIRSFFEREEQLLKKPKTVPDSASEVFEPKTGSTPPSSAPSSRSPVAPSQSSSSSSLPFSAAEFKQALAEKSVPPSPAKPVAQESVVTKSSPVPAEHHFDAELRAFEDSMASIPAVELPASNDSAPVHSAKHSPVAPSRPSASSSPAPPMTSGFFSSFEEFMQSDDLPESAVLNGDLLHKMRVFHDKNDEGLAPIVHSEDAVASLRRRLHELKVLEHEWYSRYRQSKEVARSMQHLEEEIDERTVALKNALSEARHTQLLSKKVSEEHVFVLHSGERVDSLGSLLRAAMRMDSHVFAHHVSRDRNDFAAWIAAVFDNELLASRVSLAKRPSDLVTALSEFK